MPSDKDADTLSIQSYPSSFPSHTLSLINGFYEWFPIRRFRSDYFYDNSPYQSLHAEPPDLPLDSDQNDLLPEICSPAPAKSRTLSSQIFRQDILWVLPAACVNLSTSDDPEIIFAEYRRIRYQFQTQI